MYLGWNKNLQLRGPLWNGLPILIRCPSRQQAPPKKSELEAQNINDRSALFFCISVAVNSIILTFLELFQFGHPNDPKPADHAEVSAGTD